MAAQMTSRCHTENVDRVITRPRAALESLYFAGVYIGLEELGWTFAPPVTVSSPLICRQTGRRVLT